MIFAVVILAVLALGCWWEAYGQTWWRGRDSVPGCPACGRPWDDCTCWTFTPADKDGE